MAFEESEHPRDRQGKFTEKERGKSYSESVDQRIEYAKKSGIELPLNSNGSLNDLELQNRIDKKRKEGKVELTQQEFAMFYERMGGIRRGDYADKLPSGDLLIPLETKQRGVLVTASGTYEHPKIKSAFVFEDREDMYNIIERLKDYE